MSKRIRRKAFPPIFLLLILISVSFGLDAFGFGLKWLPVIGGISSAHFYILSLILLSIIVFNYNPFHTSNPLTSAFSLLALFLVFQAVITFYRDVLLARSIQAGAFIQNFLNLYIYFLFIPLVLWTRSKRRLYAFLKGLYFLSIVGLLVTLLQNLGFFTLPAARRQMAYFGLPRTFNPSSHLLLLGFYIILGLFLYKGFNSGYIHLYFTALLYPIAILASLSRGLTLTFGLVTIGITLLTSKSMFSAIRRLGIIFVFLLLILAIAFSLIGLDIDVLAWRVKDGIRSTLNQTGTASFRFELISKAWNRTIRRSSIFGRGFNWKSIPSFEQYLNTAITKGPVNDSIYSSIIVSFGVSGLFVYGFLFLKIFSVGKRILPIIDQDLRPLVAGVITYNAHVLINGISSNSLFGQSSNTVVVISWALLYITLYLHKKEAL